MMGLVPLVLSLTVHEWAHAYSAFLLGDDTAERQGRLTLNPIVHIDPIGTLIAPLLGVPFGWAKPVPVNPLRFRRDVPMRVGMMITAAAGPVSNLILALITSVIYGLLLRSGRIEEAGGLKTLLFSVVFMNIGLFVFNLLPIPPLDGSRVVDGLLPYRLRPLWDQYAQYAGFALIGLILVNSYVFNGSLFSRPIMFVFEPLKHLIRAVAGFS
jgi:Zn-dependent protease